MEDVGADDAVRREAEDEDQRQADQRAAADRRHAEDQAEHERRCAPRRPLRRGAVSATVVALARDERAA